MHSGERDLFAPARLHDRVDSAGSGVRAREGGTLAKKLGCPARGSSSLLGVQFKTNLMFFFRSKPLFLAAFFEPRYKNGKISAGSGHFSDTLGITFAASAAPAALDICLSLTQHTS